MTTMPKTPAEKRAETIERRRDQIKNLERKIKNLSTRLSTARRSLKGLERAAAVKNDAEALAASQGARIAQKIKDATAAAEKRALAQAAIDAMPTHFAIHNDVWNGQGSSMAACEEFVEAFRRFKLRESRDVTCAKCMAIKALWIMNPKRKPLTPYRARGFRMILELTKGATTIEAVMLAHAECQNPRLQAQITYMINAALGIDGDEPAEPAEAKSHDDDTDAALEFSNG